MANVQPTTAADSHGIRLQDGIGTALRQSRSGQSHRSTDLHSAISVETIRGQVRTRELSSFDVFALVVNKMVGTGIYTSPAIVLLLTGNKGLTMGLWAIGFIYSIISMFMYLDFAAALPFNGGELIYLEEMFAHSGIPPEAPDQSRTQTPPDKEAVPDFSPVPIVRRNWVRRLLGDGLLPYVIYSLLFLGVFNSGTNSMQTGRMILLCIDADKGSPGGAQPDVNRDLLRFIGVFVLTIISLIQYFSAEGGRSLNRFLACVKMIFLVVLLCGGAKMAVNRSNADFEGHSKSGEWWVWNSTSKWNYAKALLSVLFSFEGWENGTFVAGEIRHHRFVILQKGFLFAVFSVGLLYLVIVAVFLHAIPFREVHNAGDDVNFAPMLFGDSISARQAWAVLTAISAVGSLNAVTYTFSRVKQIIGQAEILPWSNIWKADDLINRDPDDLIHKSPQGGLILHWVMSVVVILGSSSIKNTLDSVSLPGYVQTYTHCFILMILGFGLLRLKSRETALEMESPKGVLRPSQKTGLARYALIMVMIFYGLLNLGLLVINAGPTTSSTGSSITPFPGWGFPTIVASIVAFGLVYYVLVFGAATRYFPSGPPYEARDLEQPRPEARNPSAETALLGPSSRLDILRFAHVCCEIWKDYTYDTRLRRVYRFGRRWRVRWVLEHEQTDQHATPPEKITQNGTGITHVSSTSQQSGVAQHKYIWYWIFGGQKADSPMVHIKSWWLRKMDTRNAGTTAEERRDRIR